jgi:hypothetical protein
MSKAPPKPSSSSAKALVKGKLKDALDDLAAAVRHCDNHVELTSVKFDLIDAGDRLRAVEDKLAN